MTINEIVNKVNSKEYDFLRTNPHLGKNIILLGLGGSHAYGTNVETSDLDIRGIAVNTREEILLGRDFENIVNNSTDTTIYSVKKILQLLTNCNPNTIELLGLKPEHYLFINPIGQKILDNKDLFITQKAIRSFGGYATQQLYRLQQKSLYSLTDEDYMDHIKKVLNSMLDNLNQEYGTGFKINMNLSHELELIGDFNCKMSDVSNILNELNNTYRDYTKHSHRNENAIARNKVAKHSMHLIRLYLMVFDILEKHEINTYRKNDIEFLMDIRNGKYLDNNETPTKQFMDLVKDYESTLHRLSQSCDLPKEPDTKKIDELLMSINEEVINNKN